MHTESNAKTKWCPMVRHYAKKDLVSDEGGVGLTSASFNRENDGLGSNCYCIASGCMMWRWSDRFEKNDTNMPPQKVGHCGLAGGVK